jgi:hypothetical protein
MRRGVGDAAMKSQVTIGGDLMMDTTDTMGMKILRIERPS